MATAASDPRRLFAFALGSRRSATAPDAALGAFFRSSGFRSIEPFRSIGKRAFRPGLVIARNE